MKSKLILLVCLFAALHASAAEEEFTYRDVTTTGYGQLEELIGKDIMTIDSLVVRGPINKADFTTMWKGCCYGKLQVLNLEYAAVENNKIPDEALCNREVQFIDVQHGGWVWIDYPRHVILPEKIVEIGNSAFKYILGLETINIPKSVKIFGNQAFLGCNNLKLDAADLPERLDRIGESAFSGTKLSGNLTIKCPIVGAKAFDGAYIKTAIIEETDSIGYSAFASSQVSKVVLPKNCPKFGKTGGQFNFTWLQEIELPEDMTYIPRYFFLSCSLLESIAIPKTVKRIEESSFRYTCLKTLDLHEGIDTIETAAFAECLVLKTIVFPSTLNFLGKRSCIKWNKIERIYCKSIVPPTCEIDDESTPFKSTKQYYSGITRQNVPVYVPMGTAEAYKAAPGWNHFNNYVEIAPEDFPASVDEVTADSREGDGKVYDLSGRRVVNPVSGHVYIKKGKKFVEK